MKKTIFTLMLMLASAIVVNAQSLTGKQWCTMLADEDGQNVAVALTFDKNGSYELVIAAEHQMKEDGVPIDITAGVTVPGTYTLNGKDLKMHLNASKADVEMDYEIKGLDAKTKAKMDAVIKKELESAKGDFKKEVLDGMPKMENVKIVSLESKRLILKDDNGDDITFYAQ